MSKQISEAIKLSLLKIGKCFVAEGTYLFRFVHESYQRYSNDQNNGKCENDVDVTKLAVNNVQLMITQGDFIEILCLNEYDIL